MPDMSPLAAKSRRIHLREIPAAMVIWLFVVAGLRGALPPDFPGVTVTAYDSSSVAAGYVFLEMTLASTNANRYLMMLDNTGAPVWYLGVTNGINDFKVLPNGYLHYASAYHDHSWTDGGDSLHQVLDDSYKPFETITAGNNYAADSHDFQLLPNGHVLAIGYYQSRMDMSKYVAGGYPNAQVGGAVIQELDAARNVVFQWRSWDHIGVGNYFPPGMLTNPAVLMPVINAFNFNSVRMDDAGDLLVSNSGLDVWKISRQTGGILWRLGGPANEFSFTGVSMEQALQDFAGPVMDRLENGNLLLFCNADPAGSRSSKVCEYQVDEESKVATLVWSYTPATNYYSWHYGNAQRLSNENTFIGWGSADFGVTNQSIPACTEVTPDGRVVFQLKFNDPRIASGRAYRFPYPPSSQQNVGWVSGIAAGNSYEFDPTGVSMNVLDGGGSYNEIIATRESYAPVNPGFEGKAPLVLPARVNLSMFNIDYLDTYMYFDASSFSFADPESLTVYARPRDNSSPFTAQPTVYNPLTGQLTVAYTIENFYDQEFIFCYSDVADATNPPTLAAVENYKGFQPFDIVAPLKATDGANYIVNQQIPVSLAWSPNGLAGCGFQLQIATNAGFSTPAVTVSSQNDGFFVWSNAIPGTAYYYRVSSSNETGTSPWSNGRFQTVPPAISLIAPNGGEAWQRGSSRFVQWQDNISEDVAMDLYKGGVFLKTLATNASTGAWLWPIGQDLAPGSDYSIRVRSATDSNLFAASARPFAIDVPVITALRRESGAWVLDWSGTTAAVFIEFSPSLFPAQWQTVAGPTTATSWTNSATGSPAGFFRLSLQ